jgi:hypothetical protein
LGDQHFVHDAAGRSGLVRHQSLSQHFLRNFARFLSRFHDVNAAFESVFKRPLASPARVHLRFDDDVCCPSRTGTNQLARDRFRFIGRRRYFAASGGDTELLQELLGLILVDVHRVVGAMD